MRRVISTIGSLMLRFGTVALVLGLAVLSASPGLADPKGMKEGDCVGVWQPSPTSNARFVQLTDKDPSAGWSPIEDMSGCGWGAYTANNGVYGWVQYEALVEDITGHFVGSITVKGLTPNNWYLVVFQGSESNLGASGNGLWGGKSWFGFYWTDVALLKTDSNGNGSSDLLSSGGVTSTTCGTPGVNHCDPAIDDTPSLASGTYTNVTIAVKDVGSSADGTTPDIATLVSGGTAVMFEWAPITFIVP